jgi:hypothetical protein
MKTQYEVGEEIDYTGLYVVETYDNSEYDYDSELTMTDLDNYTIIVKDKDGNKVKGEFTEEGVYTVIVDAGKFESTFEVRVGTVQNDNGGSQGGSDAEPTPAPSKGCGGSVVASLIGTLTLLSFALLSKKKRAR